MFILALDAYCLLEVFAVLNKQALDIGLDWSKIILKSTHKGTSKDSKGSKGKIKIVTKFVILLISSSSC